MNGTRDINETAAADNGGGFDPQAAADLMQQTKQEARRQFEATPPWLSLVQAAVVLAAYGAIWLSVRGQHPYKGPSGLVILVVYVLVAVVLRAFIVARRRAGAGVGGRSRRLRRAEMTAVVVAIAAVYVFMGALYHAGVSDAVVYGVYPATALLITGGSVVAGLAAAREDWSVFGAALAIVAVGAGSAFAGPATVWAVAGVGVFIVLLGRAGVTAWLQRA
jgi:hypothetical protein